MWNLTGNDIFDLYFGTASLFAFLGWSAGVIRGMVRRVIR